MAERKNEARWVEKSNRWRIDVQHDGVRRSFYSATPGKKGKIEAERKADKWLGAGSKRENIRLGQLWFEYLQRVKLTTGTSNYRQTEYFGRCWLLPVLEHKRVSSIMSQDWQNCIDRGFKGGLSKKTMTSIRAAIMAFYRFAKKNNIPMERPEDISIPNGAPEREKAALQPEELRTIFSTDTIVLRGVEQPFFFVHGLRFLILVGLRPGELCGLQNSDISGDKLTIRRSVNQYGEITSGKNKNARRTIVLGKWALRILEQQRDMLKKRHIISKWVFPNESGEMLISLHLYKMCRTFGQQHDIQISLYKARRTMVSLAQSGVPEQLVKMVVGHSESMDTFGVYGYTVDGELKHAASLLDGIYDRIIGKIC